MGIQQRGCLVDPRNEKTVFCIYIARVNAQITQRTANIIWNYAIRSRVLIYAYIAQCSDASSCTCVIVCQINTILFFFLSSLLSPHPEKIASMTQASFPPFQIPQENSTLYGDIPNTPNITRDRVSLPGSASQDNTSLSGNLGSISSVSSDNSLLSSAPISLYANLSPATSWSPGSPDIHTYTQLVRQYRYCQEELKKTKQEHERLKYVSLFYYHSIHP